MRQNFKLRRIQLFGLLIKIHQEQVKLDEKKRKENENWYSKHCQIYLICGFKWGTEYKIQGVIVSASDFSLLCVC